MPYPDAVPVHTPTVTPPVPTPTVPPVHSAHPSPVPVTPSVRPTPRIRSQPPPTPHPRPSISGIPQREIVVRTPGCVPLETFWYDCAGRSSLMPVGMMRIIEPIVTGEHFLAERAQCHIAEQRRGTGKMVDFGLPARLPLHPRSSRVPRLLISAEPRFDTLAACQNFA